MQGHDTNRYKVDAGCYLVDCLQCGNRFESKRSDATFCSARCRVRYSREPQKLENAIEELKYMEARIRQIANRYPHNDRVFEAVQSLSKSAANSLGIFEK